jgi:hypothetical protein
LKPATGAAGAEVISSKLLGQLLVAVNDPHAAPDARFGREASTSLAGRFAESTLLRIFCAA